ncbi:MAG: hypothetical protein LBG13_00135 [Holosporales bacterium]|jgi:hypothetical protein|nr:hypothetical protein [Holosporales bacterium]
MNAKFKLRRLVAVMVLGGTVISASNIEITHREREKHKEHTEYKEHKEHKEHKERKKYTTYVDVYENEIGRTCGLNEIPLHGDCIIYKYWSDGSISKYLCKYSEGKRLHSRIMLPGEDTESEGEDVEPGGK